MKKVFNFGKIDYYKNGEKINVVTVEVELRKKGGEKTFTISPKTKERIYTGKTTPIYYEFSASGTIWNAQKTDCLECGQCLDTIAEYIKDPLFLEIYGLWKKYHLNSLNAGTPEQEEAIQKMGSRSYNYDTVCEYLKNIGLYEVNYTGLSIGKVYNNEPYKYGHAWLIREIPQDVIKRIKVLISGGKKGKNEIY